MRVGVATELEEILGHYDIGELIDWERNDRGYVNTSYAVEVAARDEKRRYFLRKYKRGIQEQELRFEHSVISHLVEEGFGLVARVFQARDGETYVRRFEDEDDKEGVFYAVFDFLPGEDRYTCINPACSDREVEAAAAVLAQFHSVVFDFVPKGSRGEPKVVDLLPMIAENSARCETKNKNTVFDAYLLGNRNAVLDNIERTRRALGEKYQDLVHLVIHCDYHPGNLKFQNGGIVGLFDFDWCKIDARCFDVALAIFYFCAAWEEGKDGELDLDQAALFLRAYQDTLPKTQGLGPLSDVELKCLPYMMNASNLYVLNWAIEDFYGKDVDPQEYLMWLRHSVRVMRWLDYQENWKRLEKAIEVAA
jgi:homoserine kinase type II